MKEAQNVRSKLEEVSNGYPIYGVRRQEFATNEKVPFKISPEPFGISGEQAKEICAIGCDVTAYFRAIDVLYRSDVVVKNLLDTGKPEIFLADKPSQYLFVRPDLIITPTGFSVCEIETSPFGLGLAEMLNRSYLALGFETMVFGSTLRSYIQENTPTKGVIVYSKRTDSYKGQLDFLASEVFSGENREWFSEEVDEISKIDEDTMVYRGIYLDEYMTDPGVRLLLTEYINNVNRLLPSPTPYLEEKAILSFLWDSRFEQRLRKDLGDISFNHLRRVIPPTWIVGQERYFSLGLPNGISTSIELAFLSKAKRTFVLKESGFGGKSSWSEGVEFLHQISSRKVEKLFRRVQDTKNFLFVVQEFRKGVDTPMRYEIKDGGVEIANGSRVRLTPYFSVMGENPGELIGIKATGCQNTNFIHATSSSINTAVEVV